MVQHTAAGGVQQELPGKLAGRDVADAPEAA